MRAPFRLVRIACLLLTVCWAGAASADPGPGSLERAVNKSLPLLLESAHTYTTKRACFSCHHQALPVMAARLARQRGFAADDKLAREQSRFTVKYFGDRKQRVSRGTAVPGGPFTAGYALVALYDDGWPDDETTAALMAYLLKTQEENGSWRIRTHRPPLEDSHFTATALALRGLQRYVTQDQQREVQRRIDRARQWLVENSPTSNEDRIFHLLGLVWSAADRAQIEDASRQLLDRQHEDGGWGQLADMPADAYATGQALVALHEAGALTPASAAYRRGVKFLLQTQRPDGSWLVKTRSKPIQTYFESGFPHGKSQFISISGTCWATMALTLAVPPPDGNRRATSPPRKRYGIEKRRLWTTSRIRGAPEPPSPYRTEIVFPKLKFNEPLAMARVPGTNLLAVAERPGKIYTFQNERATAKKKLLFDAGTTVYGLAFHPRFQENGRLFVTVEIAGKPEQPGQIQVWGLRVKDPGKSSVLPDSRQTIIRWPADGHRGGCLRFGPDGMLYISVGDGSGIADQLQTGQDVSDLLASILRIDVDNTDAERNYAIPKDNPFVGRDGARPEIWSYGHRQVWKFSFDEQTGRLWACDVGQDLWEMVYVVAKGGNYGWSVTEGSHPFRPQRKKGPTPILKPLFEHAHSEARSLTGGYVYRSTRLAGLSGAYIYADYDTGKIWALRYEGGRVVGHRELADTQLRIVAFAQDAAGDVLLADFIGGAIHRLVPAPARDDAPEFPRRLSQTGLFASTKDHRPAAGLIPYSVNAPLWSDGAHKERFLALPGESTIQFDAVVYPQPAPGALPGWRFPHDAVLVKTFSLELEKGNAQSRRRLETRILHHKHMPGTDEVGAQFWKGYTYVWNDEQTDAALLDARGLDREYTIIDPAAAGGRRKIKWRFPSRAECTLCHTMSAKYALGVNTIQMNRDHDYGGVVANQLETLEHLGIFGGPLPKPADRLPGLVDYGDESLDLNLRARSYLHANCAHCHRKWGGGNAEFQLLADLPLRDTGTIDVPPAQGHFDLEDPRILVAGRPDRSMILFRMKRLGLGRMPHVASNHVDEHAVELIERWIRDVSNRRYDSARGIVASGTNQD